MKEAREHFIARCAICHGNDGRGRTQVGRNLYPRVPDLLSPQTQNLTDGEIHYIIENGVQLTGMPAWRHPHQETEDDSWKLVLFIRNLRPLTPAEQSQQINIANSAHYAGSQACEKCHAEIYQHWKKTPMANIVRDPREHPDAIIPNLATDSVAKFTKIKSPSSTAAFGSSATSQRLATTIFPCPRSGKSRITSGAAISFPKERTGGRRSTLPTTCSVPLDRPAMAAIPLATISTRSRSRNGT